MAPPLFWLRLQERNFFSTDVIKAWHWAIFTCLTTIIWSETLFWYRNRRQLEKSKLGGEDEQQQQIIVIVKTNQSMDEIWIKQVLADSIPLAQLRVEVEDDEENVDAKEWAKQALEMESGRVLKFGVGMVTKVNEKGLKQTLVVVSDGDRECVACSVGVPKEYFDVKDSENAFARAWKQLLV
jgi:hypothetical protein